MTGHVNEANISLPIYPSRIRHSAKPAKKKLRLDLRRRLFVEQREEAPRHAQQPDVVEGIGDRCDPSNIGIGVIQECTAKLVRR